jgi:mannose-6-phosphate isomerase-like protein (cupin superfamily)
MSMPQADSPVTGFRPFFNPATGEWITYTALAEDSDGRLVRFTWRSIPGGVITEHVHPRQEERFTILAGQAHFTLNGAELVAGPGETVVVPAGVPHSEGNPGPAEIDGIVELRPALRTKELHEALAGLVADGKTTPRGAPRNPLQLGATFWHFRHESRVTSPPIWAQNLMLPPLWALARAFGVRPYYDHWDSPRRRHSAALSSDLLGFVIVAHPFHPLNGQRLEILYAKRRGADTVFVCAGGFSGQMTLPQAWTDRGEPPGTGRLSAEGLAALGAATRALRGR